MITIACIMVLFLTGVILMLVYAPATEATVYHGPYEPLVGTEVSRAFASVMRLSFEVPGGLLIRQIHHWAALLIPASIMLQLLVAFFTGAFRRPRRGSWTMLFLLLIVALAGGWSGYALPDDMLSGSGLRIVHGITLGVPVIGSWLSTVIFGGEFPGRIIENLNLIHVIVVPVGLVMLVAGRARTAYKNKPPQFAAWGRGEHNVVGVPFLPNAAVRAGGLFAIVVGLLILMATLVTINPIWSYGPSDPGSASAGSQPDWYTGFLDGALRLVPPGWEFEFLDRTWTLAILAPLSVVGLFLIIVAVYPFLEGWVTRDTVDHHVLDRPRNTATRTAIGVAGMTFYGVLWGAASADIIALVFHVSFEGVIATLQVTLFAGPLAAFFIAQRVCLALQKKDRELLLHGYETGKIVRMPGGEYVEVRQPLDEFERWRLAAHTHVREVEARPNENGRLSRIERGRGWLAARLLADRIELPPAPRHEKVGSARTETATIDTQGR
ncbi:cytochrome b [Microbacterium yannicii]|uniref:cytochrome bc1 complex cytochrome b subunit n=1 Tax=Microbacterium yannicii TaxID=671622 RepID=UPI001ED99690|nr:cytochrome b N-terminal domain-containing protein [Microbacterium yannicii]